MKGPSVTDSPPLRMGSGVPALSSGGPPPPSTRPSYPAVIGPFRRWVVYPTLLRELHDTWCSRKSWESAIRSRELDKQSRSSVDWYAVRIATWNVNSLKARLEKVSWWLERARPDVLLMQETKLADADAPVAVFRDAGYELAHHGEGQWNGVAIASQCGIADVVTGFGDPRPLRTPGGDDAEPLAEARLIAATCGGVRVVCIYAPNGRSVGSPSYDAKLAWYQRLAEWLGGAADPSQPLVIGGDFNVAPEDADVWDPNACHGGTHVSPLERQAFFRLRQWGLVDAYRLHHPEPGRFSWWDYRAGAFHKNLGMRIDLLLVTESVAARTVWAEIDREARKGRPIPSDHAPVLIDLDQPGHPLDAGWTSAEKRIAARRTKTT